MAVSVTGRAALAGLRSGCWAARGERGRVLGRARESGPREKRPSAGPWLGEGAGRPKVDWAGRGKKEEELGSGWFVGFWAGFLPISFSFLFLFSYFNHYSN